MSASGLARTALRGISFPMLVAGCFGDYVTTTRGGTLPERVAWLQRVARRHFKWMGLRIKVDGPIPRSGLIVCNHLSYLDIVVLSTVCGCAFVSKKEVAGWPVFGAYATLGGSIYVDRERRGTVAETAAQMDGHLAAGVPLVLFPEGTSSGGEGVMPFKTPLFEPVVHLGAPVAAAALHYTLADGGSVPDEVCYWADMTLVPHLLNLVRKREIGVHLTFSVSRIRTGTRKELAVELHDEVSTLHRSMK